ncbi:Tail-anchored protein insertion receptor [Nymphaea thermarum]|nr:Tail-anchored protein insertion receptor [Nymphaea thermarum]
MDQNQAFKNGFAAPVIFFLILSLELLTAILNYLKKRGTRNARQIQLKQEIKQLLKEAGSLSSPATFAQAAKLRRAAAAKEKELAQYQESCGKDKKQSPEFYLGKIKIVKGVIYVGLIWWFWSTSVAVIPAHLLQPLGKLLFWGGGNAAGNIIRVGIIPWLVVTNRVSEFAIRKLSVVAIAHLNRYQTS